MLLTELSSAFERRPVHFAVQNCLYILLCRSSSNVDHGLIGGGCCAPTLVASAFIKMDVMAFIVSALVTESFSMSEGSSKSGYAAESAS